MGEWVPISEELPPQDKEVMMKIHDEDGSRNEAPIKRHGSMFFLPDFSMYVYYKPTHWLKK